MGPAQPSKQWVPVKRPGHKADHSYPLIAEVHYAMNRTGIPLLRLWHVQGHYVYVTVTVQFAGKDRWKGQPTAMKVSPNLCFC
jgi:hypothetical protein